MVRMHKQPIEFAAMELYNLSMEYIDYVSPIFNSVSMAYYELAKRMKLLLAVIYRLPRRISHGPKTFKKNWKKLK